MLRRLIGILVLLMTLATPLMAQELPSGDPRNAEFRQNFVEVVKLNPSITNPNSMPIGAHYVLPDGTTETLATDDQNGIWGHEFQKMYGIPYEEFLKGEKVSTPVVKTTVSEARLVSDQPVETVTAPHTESEVNWLLLFSVAVTIIVIMIWLGDRNKLFDRIPIVATTKRRHEMRKDPVTSGPAFVPNGISPIQTERLDQAFRQQAIDDAVALGERRNEINRQNLRRTSPIESGMISGEGMVGYTDHARPRRIMPAQAGYRARFMFPDGIERELMSLQGCMNPCYTDEGLTGFAFTPHQAVVPAPVEQATPVATPAPAPTPHPAIALMNIRDGAEASGSTTIRIGGQMLSLPRGAHIEIDTNTGAIEVEGGAFSLTVKRKKTATKGTKPKAVVGRKTGTDNN